MIATDRCTAEIADQRRCLLKPDHKPGHRYEGVAGQNCTCMLRWYPNRCKAHPECNQ